MDSVILRISTRDRLPLDRESDDTPVGYVVSLFDGMSVLLAGDLIAYEQDAS